MITLRTYHPNHSLDNLNAFFISALNGNLQFARSALEKVIAAPCTYDWQFQKKDYALKVLTWLNKPDLKEKIDEQIKRTRKLKKLDK